MDTKKVQTGLQKLYQRTITEPQIQIPNKDKHRIKAEKALKELQGMQTEIPDDVVPTHESFEDVDDMEDE